MAANGSPAPLFESDESRTAFVIRLPVHAGARVPPRAETGSPEVTPEVTPEVRRLLQVLDGELSRQELQQALGLKDAEHFRKAYLLPALAGGAVEMTLPATPRSSNQRYRLTDAGQRAKSASAPS
jgi:ATP-dependent DNA helicase RecG